MAGKDTGVDNRRICVFAKTHISLFNKDVDNLEVAQGRV